LKVGPKWVTQIIEYVFIIFKVWASGSSSTGEAETNTSKSARDVIDLKPMIGRDSAMMFFTVVLAALIAGVVGTIPSVSLDWEDVTCAIEKGGKTRLLLDGVCGSAHKGKITAIMGCAHTRAHFEPLPPADAQPANLRVQALRRGVRRCCSTAFAAKFATLAACRWKALCV